MCDCCGNGGNHRHDDGLDSIFPHVHDHGHGEHQHDHQHGHGPGQHTHGPKITIIEAVSGEKEAKPA